MVDAIMWTLTIVGTISGVVSIWLAIKGDRVLKKILEILSN